MLRCLILLTWLVSLALNAPGQLSFDSVIQLLEGRSGAYAGAHPPLMSALLGFFDQIVPGTALYLVLSSALFYVPLCVLVGGTERRSAMNWLAGALLIFALVTPLLLVYQGTVWKDVLFANLSLSTFTCLILAQRSDRPRARIALVASAAILGALAASARQNGLIVGLFAAVALGVMMPAPYSMRRRATHALVWALVAVGAHFATHAAIEVTAARPIGSGMSWGLTVLHRYDVAGIIANGGPPFPSSPVTSPESEHIVTAFRRDYDPSRVDSLMSNGEVAAYFREMNRVPGHWWRMVRDNPLAWLEHRAAVFRWMVAPPDVRRCLPVWLGVDGPDTALAALGLEREVRPQDVALYTYAARWFETPLFVNATWVLIALVLAGLICLRKAGRTGDMAVLAMLASALAFTATFALIGIACDVRYLFLLPVACCGALAHLAHAAPQMQGEGEASARSVGQ